MNEKEFRKLKRRELVELIYELEVDLEKLQQENEQLKQELDLKTQENRNLMSLEQAIEKLNGIYEMAVPCSDEAVLEETLQEDVIENKEEMKRPSQSESGEEDRLDEMLNQRASRIEMAIQRMEEEHRAEWQKIKDEQRNQ